MQGLTALHMAAHQGHSVIVNQLCRVASVGVDALDHAGCTPLHHATALGHDGVVMELWSKSANVDLADANGWTGSCATLWSLLAEHLVIITVRASYDHGKAWSILAAAVHGHTVWCCSNKLIIKARGGLISDSQMCSAIVLCTLWYSIR